MYKKTRKLQLSIDYFTKKPYYIHIRWESCAVFAFLGYHMNINIYGYKLGEIINKFTEGGMTLARN